MKKPLQQIGLFDVPAETPAPAENVVLSNTAPTPPRIVEIVEEEINEEENPVETVQAPIETAVVEADPPVSEYEAAEPITPIATTAPVPPAITEISEEESQEPVEEIAGETNIVQIEAATVEPSASIAAFAPTPPSIIEVLAEEETPEEEAITTPSENTSATQPDNKQPLSSISFIADEDIPAQEESVAVEEQPLPKRISSTRGRKSLKETAINADLIQVPEDDVLFSKQYYSIGEVATMFRENQSLIRYWETEFDILQPRKNKKGDRFFRPVDIKNLVLIYDLLRRRKFTIEGAKDFLKRNKKVEDKFAMIQSLEKIKSFLLELRTNL
jgi:DNA-binding transcriptional MerR regulator